MIWKGRLYERLISTVNGIRAVKKSLSLDVGKKHLGQAKHS